jgi:hypothetical protein
MLTRIPEEAELVVTQWVIRVGDWENQMGCPQKDF